MGDDQEMDGPGPDICYNQETSAVYIDETPESRDGVEYFKSLGTQKREYHFHSYNGIDGSSLSGRNIVNFAQLILDSRPLKEQVR